jgi:outer membrane receptor protein involved in Fe transport
VEGWKSVNADPSNFSAHRFLADSYSALPRHEIARVSELLRSQLLQPNNITPIQPRLSESNLFLISAGGPAALSFNEFNPLFNRDRIALQVSGIAGENDTYGGEGVVSGIYKKASFSVGYTHFETDGFRKNNAQDDDLANAFLQLELSPKTSIQAEYRYRDTENGDLELNFFPDDFRPGFKRKVETNSYRLGLKHALSPSIILASFMYQRQDSSLHDEPPVFFINSIDFKTDDQEAFSGEIQHLFRSKYFNITSGAGHFNIDREDDFAVELNLPPPPFGPGPITLTEIFDEDVKHTNLYLYFYINWLRNVTFTLGASGDFFDTDSTSIQSEDQFNPKFGVTWNPFPATTLRAAAFRVLKRTLITDQTLEPTQVAGFNQFYDDLVSTDAWRYGVAIDQKFSENIFGGMEFSRRDLEVPFRLATPAGDTLQRADWNEYFGRAYLFWAPHPWLGLSAEYQYERFKRDDDFIITFKDVKTHRVPLGINFFHPCGLSASLKPTYFNQRGDFLRRGGDFIESSEDDFWVVDAAISYRLPKRYGFITVGATNIFDEDFKYQETDLDNPIVQPGRVFFTKITLALP